MTALDVRDLAAVQRTIEVLQPDIVAHLAAETDLETCELDSRPRLSDQHHRHPHIAAIAGDRGAMFI